MRVLILCESSGQLRRRFYDAGHMVVSCDLLPCDDPKHTSSAYHYEADAMELVKNLGEWDLVVAHPPCTALTVAGNAHYGEGQPRYKERLDAAKWTRELWDECCKRSKRVAFENPVSVLTRLAGLPKATYVHPWQHGHKEQKKTAFHLHNLPPITETNNVYTEMMELPIRERQRIHYLPPSKDRWKVRSKTFSGIADAIVKQWA